MHMLIIFGKWKIKHSKFNFITSFMKISALNINLLIYSMWPDLPKRALFAHNFKVHISPPPDVYNNRLTIYVCTIAKHSTVRFYWGFFLQPVGHPWVPAWSINALSCLNKHTAGKESPCDYLVRLGMDLATFCDTWSWKQFMPFCHIGVLVVLITCEINCL